MQVRGFPGNIRVEKYNKAQSALYLAEWAGEGH
jgi:hypothetical protein